MKLYGDKEETSLISCIGRFLDDEGSDDDACNLLQKVQDIYNEAWQGTEGGENILNALEIT